MNREQNMCTPLEINMMWMKRYLTALEKLYTWQDKSFVYLKNNELLQ